MRNKKRTYVGLALLIAVLVLGVGYALTANELTVGGTATANTATTGFKVILSNAEKTAGDEREITTLEIADGDLSATMNVSLTNVGDTATATFTVKNASDAGMVADFANAVIAVAENTNEGYFEVTHSTIPADTELAVDGTTTFTVTVKLIKANLGEQAVTGNFEVTLSGVESAQG